MLETLSILLRYFVIHHNWQIFTFKNISSVSTLIKYLFSIMLAYEEPQHMINFLTQQSSELYPTSRSRTTQLSELFILTKLPELIVIECDIGWLQVRTPLVLLIQCCKTLIDYSQGLLSPLPL